jgi:hypothetical protein
MLSGREASPIGKGGWDLLNLRLGTASRISSGIHQHYFRMPEGSKAWKVRANATQTNPKERGTETG